MHGFPVPPRSPADNRSVPARGVLAVLLLAALTCLAPLVRAAETPRRGGVLQLSSPNDWRTFDPAIAFDAESIPLVRLLFRCLLDYDREGNVIPDQAESWSVSDDGRTYTFHLKPGLRFSHGREVEAEDYVFALERVLDSKTASPGQGYYLEILGAEAFRDGKASRVAGLRAPDKHTLVIELSRPSYVFRYVMCMTFASAVPRERVRELGPDFRFRLEGSGPYRLTEWRRDVRWRLDRNPHYTGTNAWFDAVEVMIGPDPTVAAMLLERGEIHRATTIGVIKRRFERDPILRTWIQPARPVGLGFLFMNTELKPFNDVRVRRALNHAIDKERMTRLTGGTTVPARGVVPPSMPWSNPDLPVYPHSQETARSLLRDAGFPDGFRSTLWYIGTREIDRIYATAIQADAKTVGVELELRPVSFTAFEVAARTRGQIPCGIWGWYQDYPDPANFIDVLLNGDRLAEAHANNHAFFSHPEIDGLIREAAATLDRDRRFGLFRKAEVRLMQEAPWVPLYNEELPVIYHPRLRGHVHHPVWLWTYEDMWLAPEP